MLRKTQSLHIHFAHPTTPKLLSDMLRLYINDGVGGVSISARGHVN